MFVHVHNLSLHRQHEQSNKIKQKDGPEDRDVKYAKKCHEESHSYCPCRTQPELEFR